MVPFLFLFAAGVVLVCALQAVPVLYPAAPASTDHRTGKKKILSHIIISSYFPGNMGCKCLYALLFLLLLQLFEAATKSTGAQSQPHRAGRRQTQNGKVQDKTHFPAPLWLCPRRSTGTT
jgi:hypothetical protein